MERNKRVSRNHAVRDAAFLAAPLLLAMVLWGLGAEAAGAAEPATGATESTHLEPEGTPPASRHRRGHRPSRDPSTEGGFRRMSRHRARQPTIPGAWW